jgi:Putative beta-barrel porin-2, OmpL-like. bbp2
LRTPVGNSGIDWKVGLWDTIIGYESSSDPLNPNFTRSYGWGIEPTSHTGILGTYKVNDMISVTGGVADSSNVGPSGTIAGGANTIQSQKAYMGSIALTAPDSFGFLKGATLTAGVIDAPNAYTTGTAPTYAVVTGGGTVSTIGVTSTTPGAFVLLPGTSGTAGTTSYYAGATIPTPLSALKVGGSFDYLDIHNAGGEAWVIGGYASYQFNDKTSFNLRGEYGQSDAGYLYSAGGLRNGAEEVTATLQYNLWANVLSRAEFRWDHAEHGTPFGAGDQSNAFLLALNLIYQF